MMRHKDSETGKVSFKVGQLRNKFKKCVKDCKHASMTIKTSSGIKRFQESKGYGTWFSNLLPLVKSRDSCRPDMAVEPSSQNLPCASTSSTEACSDASGETQDQEESYDQYIPVKKEELPKRI